MTKDESDRIIMDVKSTYNKISRHSQKAQLTSFLSYYHVSLHSLSFSADGNISNYEEFRKLCNEYYGSLKEQKIITIREKYHVIDRNLVIVGWTGNITAHFKNGDIVKMNNYSITSVFKKLNDEWKVIHDHESALPPVIIKKE